MLNFNTRLSRRKFLLPWLLLCGIGFTMLIGCIIHFMFMLYEIDKFISINWPIGYYTEEFDTFLNSLANDVTVHSYVKWNCIFWFIWLLYTVITAFPILSLTVRRLHDVSKSIHYLPISIFYIFRDSDIFENKWGKPE